MGTSGAEIGAAFGGNKVSVLDIFVVLAHWLITPIFLSEHRLVCISVFDPLDLIRSTIQYSRGRESGGDAWKQYVRWSACTSAYL